MNESYWYVIDIAVFSGNGYEHRLVGIVRTYETSGVDISILMTFRVLTMAVWKVLHVDCRGGWTDVDLWGCKRGQRLLVI